MAYWAELERKWRKNRTTAGQRMRRPKSLRGRDFINELCRLSVMTEDPRFDGAGRALFEHGIIDENLKFTRWQAPAHMKHDAKMNAIYVSIISVFKSNEKSLHRACAECAATTGHPAVSFKAAVKDLETLYKKLGKTV